MATAPPSCLSSKRGRKTSSVTGVRFLLISAAGIATAAGIGCSRLVLSEAGEVLLLLTDYDPAAVEGECQVEGVDVDFYQCAESTPNYLGEAGQVLIAMASAPHLRAAPLILVVLSATAFVMGVAMTQRELRGFLAWVQSLQKHGDECLALVGASDAGELALKVEETSVSLQKRVANTLERLDTMALDDVLCGWVKAGMELSAGAVGGVVLYSLPEELFAKSASSAKDARRRLVRAADPSLERILFRPGGAWEALPPFLRQSLTKGPNVGPVDAPRPLDEDGDTVEISDNDEDSSDTPLACPLSSVSGKGNDELGGCPRVVHAEVRGDASFQSNGKGESIADALAATVTELVASNLSRRRGIDDRKPRNGSGNVAQQKGPQQEEQNEWQKQPLQQPPPLWQLEKILRHTTIAASFLFLCHLRRSPSTRKAWGSAIKLLASLGLASTAMGAGVASALLHSNQPLAGNPVGSLLCSSLSGVAGSSPLVGLPRDISNKVHWMLDRMRAEIRKNKKLQAAVALAVLYGMKRSVSSSRRRGPRSQRRR